MDPILVKILSADALRQRQKQDKALPLAERPTALDGTLPIPFNTFYSAFLDAYQMQKRIHKDHDTAVRAALVLVGKHFGVDPGLYVAMDDL